MASDSGGRVTLRLARSGVGAVTYDGTVVSRGREFGVHAELALPKGAVSLEWTPEAPPEWLVDLTRGTLRAAFRSTGTGGRWPRRLSRWREAPATVPGGGDE